MAEGEFRSIKYASNQPQFMKDSALYNSRREGGNQTCQPCDLGPICQNRSRKVKTTVLKQIIIEGQNNSTKTDYY
jgi:hypothetical protein